MINNDVHVQLSELEVGFWIIQRKIHNIPHNANYQICINICQYIYITLLCWPDRPLEMKKIIPSLNDLNHRPKFKTSSFKCSFMSLQQNLLKVSPWLIKVVTKFENRVIFKWHVLNNGPVHTKNIHKGFQFPLMPSPIVYKIFSPFNKTC